MQRQQGEVPVFGVSGAGGVAAGGGGQQARSRVGQQADGVAGRNQQPVVLQGGQAAAMPASGPRYRVRRQAAPASQRGVGVQVAVGADQAGVLAAGFARPGWPAHARPAFGRAGFEALSRRPCGGPDAGQQQRGVAFATVAPPVGRCAWLPPVTASGGVFFFPERRVALEVIHDEFAGGKGVAAMGAGGEHQQ